MSLHSLMTGCHLANCPMTCMPIRVASIARMHACMSLYLVFVTRSPHSLPFNSISNSSRPLAAPLRAITTSYISNCCRCWCHCWICQAFVDDATNLFRSAPLSPGQMMFFASQRSVELLLSSSSSSMVVTLQKSANWRRRQFACLLPFCD